MNSSGNNIAELKKEITSLKKKISEFIELCKLYKIDEERIFRILKNNNNSRNEQKARKNANQSLARRKKEALANIARKKEDLFLKYSREFITAIELSEGLEKLDELEGHWNFPN